MSPATQAVQRLVGATPTNCRPVSGGLWLVKVSDGRELVVKRGSGPNATAAEAAGLRWLSTSGDVPVPEVHGVDDDWLLIDYIASAAPSVAAAHAFGAGLAQLHLRGAAAFGAAPPGGPVDAWIGLAPMRNVHTDDWPTFYATHRVEPYLRMARDAGTLSAEQAAVVTRVCDSIETLAGPPEPPARLHGDAWRGNLHWAPDGVWLLDPAAHGGHRETDLAMIRLFGAPLLEHILDAYAQAAADHGDPLADGWTDRVSLHQLFPLLVHTALFGSGYAQQAVSAAKIALTQK